MLPVSKVYINCHSPSINALMSIFYSPKIKLYHKKASTSTYTIERFTIAPTPYFYCTNFCDSYKHGLLYHVYTIHWLHIRIFFPDFLTVSRENNTRLIRVLKINLKDFHILPCLYDSIIHQVHQVSSNFTNLYISYQNHSKFLARHTLWYAPNLTPTLQTK